MTTSSEFSTDTCGVPREFSQTMEMTLQQTADFFRTYDCFLLCCHANPDGDTLGSALALYHMLDLMGKQVQIVCPTPVPQRLSFLTRETPIETTLPPILLDIRLSVSMSQRKICCSHLPPYFLAMRQNNLVWQARHKKTSDKTANWLHRKMRRTTNRILSTWVSILR